MGINALCMKCASSFIDIVTRILLIALLIGYLTLAMLQPAVPMGESGSFTLLTVSLVESGDFIISEEDYQTATQLFPSHAEYLDWYYNDFLPRDAQGNAYPWYFGIYSFLCIPLFLILRLLQFEVAYAFAITNALLLSGALYIVYRECRLKSFQRLLLLMLLGLSPIIRYIYWQSYEVATCAFIMVSMVYWFTGRRCRSALFLSLAGTMNPTAMGFGILMILEYFFQQFKENQWNFTAFVHWAIQKWKEIALYALCFVPCLIPVLITYFIFHAFNAVAMLGVADPAGVFPRLLMYLFDLNLGLLPYTPLLLISMLGIIILSIKQREWKLLFAVLGTLITMVGFSITSHINCGMEGIARYNAWLLPMLIFTAFYAVDTVQLNWKKQIAVCGEIVSIMWCFLIVVVVAYSPSHGSYVYWTPIAELVMEYAPQLYNPLPSTFNSRTTHIDGGYEITEPIIYVNQNGYVRKVLLPTSLGRDALDNLAVGDQDQDIFNAECEKIDESKSEYCYLNFPHGTEITMAEPYILGTEILFTNENDGRKYFTSGISAIEGDFAWSDGMTSNMTLNIGEVNQDITAEINFKGIYNGSQALVITSHGRELFNQVVTPDNPSVSFVIPQEIIENGVVDLELSYPNAARPSDSGSSDTRLLAFAWERISFQKVDE